MTERLDYISERIEVSEKFQPVFSHFYYAANIGSESLTKTLLPNYQTVLVFCFGGEVSLSVGEAVARFINTCLVLGPIKRAFDYTLAPGTELLVINFKGDAFYRFFGRALIDHFFMHPDDLLTDSCFAELTLKLQAKSNEERIRYLLAFCEPYLRMNDQDVAHMLTFHETHTWLNPIQEIASETRQTERNLQLKHKKILGYSAKELNRYYRFLKAIQWLEQQLKRKGKINWFELIEHCSYYDQSQLIHDFKHFTQLTPKQYLSLQHQLCNPNSVD